MDGIWTEYDKNKHRILPRYEPRYLDDRKKTAVNMTVGMKAFICWPLIRYLSFL